MDYIAFDALRNCGLRRVAFTYDIFCKWWIHLDERSRALYPVELVQAFHSLSWRGFIPKMHIWGHSLLCHHIWLLNYHPGVGRCQSVRPDLAPEGARVTPKDVGGWSGCSGAYRGVCLSGCTLRSCTQRRCTCTVSL
jgi:hypothetical protein